MRDTTTGAAMVGVAMAVRARDATIAARAGFVLAATGVAAGRVREVREEREPVPVDTDFFEGFFKETSEGFGAGEALQPAAHDPCGETRLVPG
ncbi:MAG: hypothetical protein NTY02_12130 [Acidobacteria bacterium]|nr:hypothetical protein [Acidobacteriota bacterium]